MAQTYYNFKVTAEEVAEANRAVEGKRTAAGLEELFQSLYDSVTQCHSCGNRFTVSGGDRRYEDDNGRPTGRCDECEYEFATDPDNKWTAIL